jgi:hypothetical protein
VTPYYSAGGVRLYLGDARAVLPELHLDPTRTVVITDPVWPNAPPGMFPEVPDAVAAEALLRDVAAHWPRLARRAVVQLSLLSDPRILRAVPEALPYFAALPLFFDVPGYAGTVMLAGDVAHVFGGHERPEGARVVPGRCSVRPQEDHPRPDWHPCPRRPSHVRWLVRWLTQRADVVLDPFAGSGTTLRAAYALGREAVGVEVVERYAERTALQLELDREQNLLDACGQGGGR